MGAKVVNFEEILAKCAGIEVRTCFLFRYFFLRGFIVFYFFVDTNNSCYLCNCVKRHNKHDLYSLTMDINTIIIISPDSILIGIAERVKERRLEQNLTQKAFAKRAGIGYDAYRKFESTGEITLRNLVFCAIALDNVDDFKELFTKKSYQSIDDLLKTKDVKKRKRGSRNE